MSNVLLTSAGRRVGLVRAFQEALGGTGRCVLAVDRTPSCAAASVADGFFEVPPIVDDRYLAEILELCQAESISLVIPLLDPELPLWSEARSTFADSGILVNVSGPRTVNLAHDKWGFADFLTAHGLPCLPWAPARAAFDVLGSQAADSSAFVLKPRFGSASQRVYRLPSLRPEILAGLPDDVFVQRQAPGFEINIDVFADESSVMRGCVVREVGEMRAGEVSKARTVQLPEVERMITTVVALLNDVQGVISMDAFYDPATSTLWLLEINARFSGGYVLSHAAGAPFVRWLCDLAVGTNPNFNEVVATRNISMVSFDSYVFREQSAI